MLVRFCLPILSFLLVLQSGVMAQQFRTNKQETLLMGALPSNITISRSVDEVNLAFTVIDKKGHFIKDLGPADFALLDNHVPPDSFRVFQQQTELPLRIALLIDASDSVKYRFKYEQEAAVLFLKKILRPDEDRAFVVTFNDRVHLIQDLSGNLKDLQKSIKHTKAEGNTALYDAVIFAGNKLQQLREDTVTRKIIILISDGSDTASHNALSAAQAVAVRSEALLMVLSTNEYRDFNSHGEDVLNLLSAPTGGSILPAHQDWQLESAFVKIAKVLRNQYFIAYQPPAFRADGSYRPIELILRNPKLKVRCRSGYFARQAPSHN